MLPRQYRDSERSRLRFLQVFNSERQYNKALPNYKYKMSVVYNTRNPLPTGPYSSLNDDHNDDHNDGVVPRPNGFNPLNNGDPTLIPGSSSPTPSRSNSMSPEFLEDGPLPRPSKGATKNPNGRMKPIPKPLRQPVKGRNGKYACTWPDCRANVKEFSRKCEWRYVLCPSQSRTSVC